ncbi:MAG: hypothetical protein IPJ88_06110 [Myxococcales bacterium]|nr:MAG: hypothetical protein IPJ88_06110 [Myxococcales bacterium]
MHKHNKDSLLHDCRGAAMLLALFFGCFLVASLFHLIGVGRTALYQSRLQETADATAYTAASQYARSMNLIALSNSAQLIAYGSLIGLGQSLDLVKPCADSGRIFGYGPWARCIAEEARVEALLNQRRPELVTLISQATKTAELSREKTPAFVAQLSADFVANHGNPVVAGGIVASPMPLYTSDYRILCALGSAFGKSLVDKTFDDEILGTFTSQIRGIVSRDSMPACERENIPGLGAQLMDPANQSGTEALQIRSFVFGKHELISSLDGAVGLVAKVLGKQPGSSVKEMRLPSDYSRVSGRVFLAQAEYYSSWENANTLQSDTPTLAPEHNTFTMQWRSRLRRFRIQNHQMLSHHDRMNAISTWTQKQLIPACQQLCVHQPCPGSCASLAALRDLVPFALH